MRRSILILLSAALIASGCGGGDDGATEGASERGTGYAEAVRKAQRVELGGFPSAEGRTLAQLGAELPSINLGLATSVYVPGRNRLAFGMLDNERSFAYGPTAVYLARSPGSRAVIGPVAAPADPLIVDPPFRSQGAAGATDDIAAIYEAQVEIPRPGRWYVLAVTRLRGGNVGASAQITVAAKDPVPSVGSIAPVPETDTRESAGGDIAAIDTRRPPTDMHADLREVAGRKPVALLFATPQLCQTRVCGPVVDIAVQLRERYGDRIEFIHQEVYVDNEVGKGLRPPLKAYRLTTEPWLFTIDADGKIAARLQGSFGNLAFERALKAAL